MILNDLSNIGSPRTRLLRKVRSRKTKTLIYRRLGAVQNNPMEKFP